MFSILITIVKKIRDFYLRKIKWRKYKIAKGFHAGVRVRLWSREIIIGKYFYIGRDSQIECNVEIGDYVICGNKVAFVGRYDHNYQQIGTPIRLSSQIKDSDYNWKGLSEKVIVEDDVWIGYGSIIMSGVRIKRGSIVAAGSVVTRDIDEYSIYAGVPARRIKSRFDNINDLNKHIHCYLRTYS